MALKELLETVGLGFRVEGVGQPRNPEPQTLKGMTVFSFCGCKCF